MIGCFMNNKITVYDVLIIEQDIGYRYMMYSEVKRSTPSCRVASTVREAKEMIKSGRYFRSILVDICSLNDVHEIADMILSGTKSIKQPKLYLVSESITKSEIEKELSKIQYDYVLTFSFIPKPYSPGEITQKLLGNYLIK